jgi:hypothetical protein
MAGFLLSSHQLAHCFVQQMWRKAIYMSELSSLTEPLPYQKLQARGLADTAIVVMLLQCCHSEW